jgi:hypothetical protein
LSVRSELTNKKKRLFARSRGGGGGGGGGKAMEDIEDVVGELDNSPLGLHLPALRNNSVSIKPKRRKPSSNLRNSKSDSVVVAAVDVPLSVCGVSVPGTQVGFFPIFLSSLFSFFPVREG